MSCCTLRCWCLAIGYLTLVGCIVQLVTPANWKTEGTLGIQISYLITLAVTIAFIVGVHKDNKKLIIPWLIIIFLEMIILTVYIGPFVLWHINEAGKYVFIVYLVYGWPVAIISAIHFKRLHEADKQTGTISA